MDTIDMYPFKLIRALLFVWLMVAAVGLKHMNPTQLFDVAHHLMYA